MFLLREVKAVWGRAVLGALLRGAPHIVEPHGSRKGRGKQIMKVGATTPAKLR